MENISKNRHQRRIEELLNERYPSFLPVWLRAPKEGPEPYTGVSRSMLYRWDAEGKIVSRCIREPGKVKGIRLFNLKSILDHIESSGAKKEVA